MGEKIDRSRGGVATRARAAACMLMLSACGGQAFAAAEPTPPPRAVAAPPSLCASAADVAGTWRSDTGLTFQIQVGAAGRITGAISSSLHPGVSQITSGDFEASTRTLSLAYTT